MQKEVGNKTLGGYLRKIDMLCDELKLSYQVEKDNSVYAVNLFKSVEDAMDVFTGGSLHEAMLNAITFLNDKKESSKAKSDIEEVVVDECNDQAKLIKNYKEPQYSF
ncbi:hypothetical protein [Piscirickettsia salmonis]|uniref:hypothetical protein n=1 Tax=Piscirickettsia salmonis TaxID=1238 RepID=UPI0006BCF701|nr:hypothetical protein [Piscirickettsia salmonis]ALA26686.1 3,4-Dihydroxy-2-butanone 4-phosphate synthase [Piscirickettsia salmonis]APS45895.1 hypothetical protein AVI48_15815 [Piscirickettsia salmonis]APS49222.1 hypothetical protein AVI49_16310 [Piscirickettsia salmonis]QGO82301.1 hypothetical protein Psal107_03352 [Piscirickettsia salmonis]QGP24130.1 hypothetical protein Psal158_03304 [Piscirickettsia salmonis]